MIRKIIRIDKERCNGCGLCVEACHEGAIGLVGGKAQLLRDDYCDGLGDCLPACPTDAISFEEREALAYDEEAVQTHLGNRKENLLSCGCPGSEEKIITHSQCSACETYLEGSNPSQLTQWPVQIKLVSVNAPYFKDADLLIAADCSAFAYGDFHNRFIKGRKTLIGCPKLDEGDYSEKLSEIFKLNSIKSITVVRMEVPCCGGLEKAVRLAVKNSGKDIPLTVVTVSSEGKIVDAAKQTINILG